MPRGRSRFGHQRTYVSSEHQRDHRTTAAEQVRAVWWDGPHLLAGSESSMAVGAAQGRRRLARLVRGPASVVRVHIRADVCRR
ncbi:hypothetical protein [Micromonospora chersina]|uniref:hypothetical protein n=1 Tax=Micromonospora chersina TaxID=47854 RepID=UPI0037240387